MQKLMQTIKNIAKIGLFVLLSAVLAISCFAKSTNWGLSFPAPGAGAQPQGMASREKLLESDTYFVGNAHDKIIYLTFDAGFENGYTAPILDVLKKHNVPAAFFLVGTYIRDRRELVTRMVDEGHIVANHTMTHPNMSVISNIESFKKELEQCEHFYKEITGQDMPKYYRPPKGIYSEENLKLAKELGYKTIFWSLAYVDWYIDNQPSHKEAFDKLIPRAHPGMVLMLHNTSRTNAEILDELITKYREMGYEFKSLDHLVGQ